QFISVGSVEPKFYALLRDKLGLGDDTQTTNGYNPRTWPQLREKFALLFAARNRDEWCALLEGSDVCFAPVLSPDEAADHPHLRARRVFDRTRGTLQANPAPRFGGTPAPAPGPVPERGEHTEAVWAEWTRQ
ncbi:CoA transferase, partial [Burkholderia pseudomallei]|uniref:CoA transferase n=1 Tax=Burkholderia pseudomallei TaxID=28450 RepID=UPI001AD6E0A1